MIVDAHQHFWRVDRGDYAWLSPALEPLCRDFLPEHLAPVLADCNVHATVLVQAAATDAETAFLLDLSSRCKFVAGVVGWIDFEAADVRRRVHELVEHGNGKLKGLRPMIQDIGDTAWVASPSLDPAFDALAETGLSFDALVRTAHLESLARRLDRSPNVRTVIDHCAKPPIATRAFDDWAHAIERIARHRNVWCKLSGLLTEAGAGWNTRDIEPFVAHVLRCFGSDRVLWGSDWPMLNLASDYRTWFDIAHDLVRALAPDSGADVFGANAIHFYALAVGVTALLLLSSSDNVAVAQVPLAAGTRQRFESQPIEFRHDVPAGFKVAVRDIAPGEKITKHGAPIGSATRAIRRGDVVHLENMKSDYLVTHARGGGATGPAKDGEP